MDKYIKTSTLASHPASGAVCAGVSLLLLAVTASAQGIVSYAFTGNVRSLNPASEVFPGVTLGSSVQGVFTVDYNAVDADPGPGVGQYASEGFSLTGTIGAAGFSTLASPASTVRLTDNVGGDWVIFNFAPMKGLQELSLTFHDPGSQALQGDALPGSAAEFAAFPLMVLYATGTDGKFGQYQLNATMTRVPEPSSLAFCAAGLILIAGLRGRTTCHLPISGGRP